jgi:hypothetical protein
MTGGNGGRHGTSRGRDLPLDELRKLVREVLADVVGTMPALPTSPAAPAGPPSSVPSADATAAPASPGAFGSQAVPPTQPAPRAQGQRGHSAPGQRDDIGSWTVRISTDEELHAFVLRVLKLAGNPKVRGDLISGRARFRLAAESAAGPQAAHQVEKGAVTERVVAAAAAAGARLVLGPRAVLTPLARDKARALGVPIERTPVSPERPRGGLADERAPSDAERAPSDTHRER